MKKRKDLNPKRRNLKYYRKVKTQHKRSVKMKTMKTLRMMICLMKWIGCLKVVTKILITNIYSKTMRRGNEE